jgi:homoserine kinase
MNGFRDAPVRVRVPATSANLGPGFDTLGLALSLHDEVTAQVEPAGVVIEVRGEGAEDAPRDESHLVLHAMRRAFDAFGVPLPGLRLSCVNAIPHARGLGSSAAAIVAGVLLARGLVRDGAERMGPDGVLALAADVEGHADNVAACLLGGFTTAWVADGGARAVRREVHADVRPIAFIPETSASTAAARAALPSEVAHADAAFNAARAGLLVTALTTEPDLLLAATEDRLHQPYRAAAMASSADLVARLRAAGHPAVVSGAGPTVLVLARGEDEVEQVGSDVPKGWRALPLAVDTDGARVEIRPAV